jgi:hypothetical protein
VPSLHSKSPPTSEVERILAQVEADLSTEAWWTSGRRKDTFRRSQTITILDMIRRHHGDGSLSIEAVGRIVERLRNPDMDVERIVVGQSVGYKKGRKLRWLDIRDVADPLEASRMADRNQTVISWKQEGSHPYGITPMIEMRQKAWSADLTAEEAGPDDGTHDPVLKP